METQSHGVTETASITMETQSHAAANGVTEPASRMAARADIGPARRYLNKKIYNVFLLDQVVSTTVTKSESAVGDWISRVYAARDAISADYLIVGLDAIGYQRQRPQSYYTLELCDDRSCLVYQISLSKHIPQSLTNFLADENIVFVGLHIESKLKRLSIKYGIGSEAFYLDLGHLASVRNKDPLLKNFQLGLLSMYVLLRDFQLPPESVQALTDNNWNGAELVHMQVLYATIGAFLSLEIGCALNVARFISRFRGRRLGKFFSL